MQNRYVGDVGDFGKYALLRVLVAVPTNLAIVWCLYPDEDHNSDGKHVSYLGKNQYRSLDSDLYDSMKRLVYTDNRSVAAVRRERLFPEKTVYFEPSLRDASVKASRAVRMYYRENWLGECLALTRKSDLVFFDPDNGLAPSSKSKGDPNAGKYIFLDEVLHFTSRGQSLVLYHHINRTASAETQANTLAKVLQEASGFQAFPLLYRRGSCRIFCVLAAPRHARSFKNAIDEMLDRWRGYFELSAAI